MSKKLSNLKLKCEECTYKKQVLASSNAKNPVFSFKYAQKKYGLTDCPPNDKIALVDKLFQLSQMTWQNIFQNDRHKTGQEKISLDSILVPIPSCVKKDTNLISIRYKGKAPMIGFRENDIFHILWVDYNFKVYNHE